MSVWFYVWLVTAILLVLALRDLWIIGRAYRRLQKALRYAADALVLAEWFLSTQERRIERDPADFWKGGAE